MIVHAVLRETVRDMVVTLDAVYSTPIVTPSKVILGLQDNQRVLQQLRGLDTYADAGMAEHIQGLRQFQAVHFSFGIRVTILAETSRISQMSRIEARLDYVLRIQYLERFRELIDYIVRPVKTAVSKFDRN